MIGVRDIRIETPEGIGFSLPVAGPITRALAILIDTVVTAGAAAALGRIFSAARLLSDDAAAALGTLSWFAVSVGYGLILEWFWRGQTVGKRVLGVRVMDAAGLRLRFEQIVIRNIVRWVDMLPFLYVVGGTAALLSRRGQRFGDVAASTIVVRIPAATIPRAHPARRGHYNSLLGFDLPVSRLRSRVTPAMAALAIEALARRDDFDPIARVRVFGELAAKLRLLAPFPEDVTAPLSDEQYVRNVAEVVAGGLRS